MHVIICDDELLYQSAIKKSVESWSKNSGHADIQITVFHSSEELFEYFERGGNADLLFLDIEIPREISGLTLAHNLRAINTEISIVFITNYDEYVYEGYTVNALRFLRKPVNDDEIYFCCSYVYNRLALTHADSIAFFSGNLRITLRYLEILYIESHSHTLDIFTTGRSKPLKISSRLTDVLALLPSKLFVFCHRSYIVNIAHIRLLTRTNLVLSNKDTLPVSRTYVTQLNQAYDNYFRGGKMINGMDNI